MKKLFAVVSIACVLLSVHLGFSKKAPDNALVSTRLKRKAPTLDGKLDDTWQLTRPFVIKTEVPSYEAFASLYQGKKYDVSIRSFYTDTDVYFFVQWTGDGEVSLERESWYYNDKEKKWMQKPKADPDAYGPPVYEDKFAFMWEIGGSSPKFRTEGGSIFCHKKLKYTNSESEKMDIWHWKLVRTGPVNQIDDQYVTYKGEGVNGRANDAGAGSYKDNVQELEKGGRKIKIPVKWIPGQANYHWIMADDLKAKKIVDIDKENNLIDEDKNVLKKEDFMLGSKRLIPSITDVKPATGSRGDVTTVAYYDEGKKTWNLEVKRARVTGNDDDVQFSDLQGTYYFSVSVFNNAAIAHATPGGLVGNSFPLVFE